VFTLFGLVTLLKVKVTAPDGAVALLLSAICRRPFVVTVAVQPDAAPRPVGWLARLAEVLVWPAEVHVPEAVVQSFTSKDFTTVELGRVNEKLYDVAVFGAELPNVNLRLVICEACAGRAGAKSATKSVRTPIVEVILNLLFWKILRKLWVI
jgi:hypothetical protein